jgi:hypothetical protein
MRTGAGDGEHNQDADRTVDDELAADGERVGFDLGTDIAHPSHRHDVAGFDLDTDIGRDNEPLELRR